VKPREARLRRLESRRPTKPTADEESRFRAADALVQQSAYDELRRLRGEDIGPPPPAEELSTAHAFVRQYLKQFDPDEAAARALDEEVAKMIYDHQQLLRTYDEAEFYRPSPVPWALM
jgi:hypothetical protein